MINSIVRQLKIDLITDTPNPIIDRFNELWCKLIVIQTNVYRTEGDEFIYYIMVDGVRQLVFYRDDANGKFLCDYYIYWLPYVFIHALDTEGIQAITKLLVDSALDVDIATPMWFLPNTNRMISL